MNKFNIDGLLALNLEEIKIVFLRCRGETVEETAEYLKIGASTIYKWMPGICELLGLSSWKEIDEELCVTLRRIVPDVRALDAGWPEAFREKNRGSSRTQRACRTTSWTKSAACS